MSKIHKIKKYYRENGSDEDYGLVEPLIDLILREKLEKKKNEFFMILKKSKINQIEFDTRKQAFTHA